MGVSGLRGAVALGRCEFRLGALAYTAAGQRAAADWLAAQLTR
jgi:hypothetical protein